MNRQIGDIWKQDSKWCVQFPKGVIGLNTKKRAKECVEVFKLEGRKSPLYTKDKEWEKYKDFKYKRRTIGKYMVELIGGTDRGGIIRVWSKLDLRIPTSSFDVIVKVNGQEYSEIASGNYMYFENAKEKYLTMTRMSIYEFVKEVVGF